MIDLQATLHDGFASHAELLANTDEVDDVRWLDTRVVTRVREISRRQQWTRQLWQPCLGWLDVAEMVEGGSLAHNFSHLPGHMEAVRRCLSGGARFWLSSQLRSNDGENIRTLGRRPDTSDDTPPDCVIRSIVTVIGKDSCTAREFVRLCTEAGYHNGTTLKKIRPILRRVRLCLRFLAVHATANPADRANALMLALSKEKACIVTVLRKGGIVEHVEACIDGCVDLRDGELPHAAYCISEIC